MKLKAIAMMERDEIVGLPSHSKYLGGVEHYSGLDIGRLDQLIALGYADPSDAQNNAPNLGKIRDFMVKHNRFLAHGYVVHHSRADCRLTIEGVETSGNLTAQEIKDFDKLFSDADEYSITSNGARCWYD